MIKINFFEHDTDATTVPAGKTIFDIGDPGDIMYGVQAGIVDIKIGEKIIDSLEVGQIFGEMAIVDDSPRSATAVARTECKLIPIKPSDFLFRIQHHPMFALFVLQTVVRRLREQMQKT